MDTEIRGAERIARRTNSRHDWLLYSQLTYRAGRDPRVNPLPADVVKFGLRWWVEELEGNLVILSGGIPRGWMHITEWREVTKRCELTGPPFIAVEKNWPQQMEYYYQQAALL